MQWIVKCISNELNNNNNKIMFPKIHIYHYVITVEILSSTLILDEM